MFYFRKIFLKSILLAAGAVLALGMAAVPGAFAQDTQTQEETPGPAATRIAVDEDTGAFAFISKGEPIARLDAEGLHVLGSITYSGTLTDAGEDDMKDKLSNEVGGAAE